MVRMVHSMHDTIVHRLQHYYVFLCMWILNSSFSLSSLSSSPSFSMAPVLSSLCTLPSSNGAPVHSLRTIPHPLFHHHSRMRNLSILAATEASDSPHSSSAHHQKPLKSSSPFSSMIPPLAASILVFSVCSPPPGTYLIRDALRNVLSRLCFYPVLNFLKEKLCAIHVCVFLLEKACNISQLST